METLCTSVLNLLSETSFYAKLRRLRPQGLENLEKPLHGGNSLHRSILSNGSQAVLAT